MGKHHTHHVCVCVVCVCVLPLLTDSRYVEKKEWGERIERMGLDQIWRRMRADERVSMLTDHMALRVRKRQDSKRWIAELLSKRSPRAVFSRFDANNDGHISRSEFRNALRREFGVDERVSNEVFRQWDTDRSGTLEYGELARAMNKSVRQDANKVAHAVDSIRDRKSRSVHAIQNKFLSSVARGNQDVSPHERYIAQTILSTRSHRNRKKRRNSFSHHRRRRRR